MINYITMNIDKFKWHNKGAEHSFYRFTKIALTLGIIGDRSQTKKSLLQGHVNI